MPSATKIWWPPATSRAARTKRRAPQQETADAQANAARQQYEAALNGARQSYGAVETSQASLEGVHAQLAQAEKGAGRHHHPRALRWLHHGAPGGRGRVRRAHQQDRHHRPHRHPEAAIADAGAARRAGEAGDAGGGARRRLSRTAISPARSPPSTLRWIPSSRVFILEARFDNPGAAASARHVRHRARAAARRREGRLRAAQRRDSR